MLRERSEACAKALGGSEGLEKGLSAGVERAEW